MSKIRHYHIGDSVFHIRENPDKKSSLLDGIDTPLSFREFASVPLLERFIGKYLGLVSKAGRDIGKVYMTLPSDPALDAVLADKGFSPELVAYSSHLGSDGQLVDMVDWVKFLQDSRDRDLTTTDKYQAQLEALIGKKDTAQYQKKIERASALLHDGGYELGFIDASSKAEKKLLSRIADAWNGIFLATDYYPEGMGWKDIRPDEKTGDSWLYMMDKTGQVVGFAATYPDSNIGAATGNTLFGLKPVGAEIAYFGVLPEHRGKGLAKVLLHEATQKNLARGFTPYVYCNVKEQGLQQILLGEGYLAHHGMAGRRGYNISLSTNQQLLNMPGAVRPADPQEIPWVDNFVFYLPR